jgi:hypothetical protein
LRTEALLLLRGRTLPVDEPSLHDAPSAVKRLDRDEAPTEAGRVCAPERILFVSRGLFAGALMQARSEWA